MSLLIFFNQSDYYQPTMSGMHILMQQAWGNSQNFNIPITSGNQHRVLKLQAGEIQRILQREGITEGIESSLGCNGFQSHSNSFGLNTFQELENFIALGHDEKILRNILGINASEIISLAYMMHAVEKKPAALVIGSIREIQSAIHDREFARQILKNTIAYSNIGGQLRTIPVAMGFNNIIERINEIREGIFNYQKLMNNIDQYRYQDTQILHNVISEHGISGREILKNAIDTSGLRLVQNIKIWLNNKAIEDKIISGGIKLYGGGAISDFELTAKSEEILTGDEIKIEIDGKIFEFIMEELSQDAKEKTVSLWGRAKAANLFEPWALKQNYRFKNLMASEIAAQICSPYEVIWQDNDYFITHVEGELLPLELAKRLAVAAGNEVRAMPDGKIYIVNPYYAGIPAMNLSWNLSLSREKKVKECDGVKIVFGDPEEGAVICEADKSMIRPGEWAEVRIYCLAEYMMTSTADIYYRAGIAIIEEIEEEVIPEAGEGSITKPIIEVISIYGCDNAEISGQKVYCPRDCRILTVRYNTQHDLWKLTNYAESKALFCAVSTENSVTVLEGTGENYLEIEEPLINEPGIAKVRAQKELREKKGPWTAKITMPYEAELTEPETITVQTPYGNGIVTASNINWETNPLKIKNEIEVLLCQA